MKTEKATQSPKVVQKKVILAKREEVFEAWTNPKILQQWMFPGSWSAVTQNDLRVGGHYTHEMIDDGSGKGPCSAGEASSHYLHTGEYLEIKPPEKLVFTWNAPSVKNTRVTIDLRDLGNSTELTLTHEFLDTEELRTSHTLGWTACLANLQTHFSK